MKYYLLIVFCIISFFGYSQNYTTAQIELIKTNQTANEGDIYHDTDLDIYYLGESEGTLIVLSYGTLNPNNDGAAYTSNYTIQPSDNGSILEFNSPTDITVTVPQGLPPGFQVSITQLGEGQVIFVGAGSLEVNNAYFLNRTSRRFSKVGIEISSTNQVILSGDVQ